MPDRGRFDPVGWFASTCIGLLVGAVALAVAVHLIRAVWPWLLGILLVVAVVGSFMRLAVAWRRRQQW